MVRRRCSSCLVTHSAPTEKNRFRRSKQISRILPSGAPRDEGTARTGPAQPGSPGMSQERLRRIPSHFFNSFLKSAFCVIFCCGQNWCLRLQKLEEIRKMGLSLSLQVVYLVHSISLCGEGVWFQCFHCAVTRGVSFCSSSGFLFFLFHSDVKRVRGKSLLNLVVKATKTGRWTHTCQVTETKSNQSLINKRRIYCGID